MCKCCHACGDLVGVSVPSAQSQSVDCIALQEMPSAEDGGRSEAGTPTPSSKASGAAPAAAAPEPERDRWVQCDRCRTWRVVPAQHWPSVEADTSEVSAGGFIADRACFCK